MKKPSKKCRPGAHVCGHGVTVGPNSDRDRLAYMLRIGAIEGDWRVTDDFPDEWHAEVMRDVVDYAMKSERRGKGK